MMGKTFFVAAFLCSTLAATAQRHEIFNPDIRTLQVVCGQKWQDMPVMKLEDFSPDNVMNISFDDLTHTYRRYVYNIEHCEADWTTSDGLFQSDYIEGFSSDNTIDDIEESINTNVLYTHYKLQIPNEKCRLKLSGNYRLTVTEKRCLLHASWLLILWLVSVLALKQTRT